ncbi:B-cell receptor CD22-like [Conger conger]|uniref:B-cell receptor CD22-like n=1 Tax=Conger conger TaxID=82655 RepID=UPI002A59B278|nr:B-cell receptor CD22-like [Conger conger]
MTHKHMMMLMMLIIIIFITIITLMTYLCGTSAENPCQVSVSGPELIQSGETVHLQCSISAACEDRPEWAWSESAQLPSSSYSQDGKTANLSFPALWSHDGVTFTCSPSGSKDACVSRSIKLTVRYAPKGVSVWTGKASDSVREGERIGFTCKVQSSNPPASYSWYKDWSQLGCTDRELNLTDIKLQDTGNYYCRATNPVGYKESPHVQITVHYGPRDTRIVASEGGVKVGRSLTLTCHAEALPEPNRYTWFHALPLTGGWTEVPAPSNRPSDRRALNWEQIRVSDAGEYMCQAANEISAKNSTSHRVDVLCECCLRHPTACPVITEGDWGGGLRRNPEREAKGKQGE